MLSSSFDLSTCFLAALHAIDSMSKRPLDPKSTVRKRSTLKRPATKQTPQIPANTEATMHESGNASILRCSDAAVQPDAATEHISIAWLSTSDDVTLIAIFEHFAYCYVAMPMVGTCKRIFTTWIMLQCWLFSLQKSSGNVRLLNRQESGNVGCIVGQSQRHPRETLS